MHIILESSASLCSFDLYYEHSSAETASNLTGHGRVLGLALSALGRKLEQGIAALVRARENRAGESSVVRGREFGAPHKPYKQKIPTNYPDVLMSRLYRTVQTQRLSQFWPDDTPFTIRAYPGASRSAASKRYAQELLKCARYELSPGSLFLTSLIKTTARLVMKFKYAHWLPSSVIFVGIGFGTNSSIFCEA